MCSLSGSCTSVVVAITAQRLHSKVRDFGSGKNFDFGIDDADMGCSQTEQRGAIIAECLSIRCSTALAPRSRSVSGHRRRAKPAEGRLEPEGTAGVQRTVYSSVIGATGFKRGSLISQTRTKAL